MTLRLVMHVERRDVVQRYSVFRYTKERVVQDTSFSTIQAR